MNPGYRELATGWQASRFRFALASLLVVVALAAWVWQGPLAGVGAGLLATLVGLAGMQWAAIDGAILQLRDVRSGFGYRLVPARHFDEVVYRCSRLPWTRLRLVRDAGHVRLDVRAPHPHTPALRQLTVWMIVHGRRRALIDPHLLDALAAKPEHGHASQPRDASHA